MPPPDFWVVEYEPKDIDIWACLAGFMLGVMITVAWISIVEGALYTDREIEMIAKAVWGEARGTTPEEQRLVVWTVLQRVDAGNYGDNIEAVVTAPRQFDGYRDDNPVCPDIYALVKGELQKWARGEEPPTLEPFAPRAPYLYFAGRRGNNWFREQWR